MTPLHHIAVTAVDLNETIQWYVDTFKARIVYQDETWGLVDVGNTKIAFVIPEQHPPHLAFELENASDFGTLKKHRDGTSSVYTQDPSGNIIEIMLKEK